MVSLGISVHTFKSFVKFNQDIWTSCVSLTVTMVMTCHFLTQLLITLPLPLSEISNCVLFFPMSYLFYAMLSKLAHLEYMKTKCSCYLPITLSKSLKIRLLQIFLTVGTLVSY